MWQAPALLCKCDLTLGRIDPADCAGRSTIKNKRGKRPGPAIGCTAAQVESGSRVLARSHRPRCPPPCGAGRLVGGRQRTGKSLHRGLVACPIMKEAPAPRGRYVPGPQWVTMPERRFWDVRSGNLIEACSNKQILPRQSAAILTSDRLPLAVGLSFLRLPDPRPRD
jgi:hypothetical protein